MGEIHIGNIVASHCWFDEKQESCSAYAAHRQPINYCSFRTLIVEPVADNGRTLPFLCSYKSAKFCSVISLCCCDPTDRAISQSILITCLNSSEYAYQIVRIFNWIMGSEQSTEVRPTSIIASYSNLPQLGMILVHGVLVCCLAIQRV